MPRVRRTLLAAAIGWALVAVPAAALGDGLHGTCYGKSGETCAEGNHRISTSWNSRTAYPASNGRYTLDLGGPVDQRITVYCDGSAVGTVYVKGSTKFDVHCR